MYIDNSIHNKMRVSRINKMMRIEKWMKTK